MNYFIKNVETGEMIVVLPHTAGEDTFSFVNANLAGTPEWENPSVSYVFPNANKDGEFTLPESTTLDVTGTWDMVAEEIPSEEPMAESTDDVA